MSCECRCIGKLTEKHWDKQIQFCPLHAAAEEMLEVCKQAKEFLKPDLVEPRRTVFWALVAMIRKAEGRDE